MINIYLDDKALDLYENTDISLSWTAFRFQTALKDMYSNDFEIPKTEHNIKCLCIYSLFDTRDIQFAGRLQPATINFNELIMPIYLQVVSIDEKTIKISIFEDRLLYTLKNKKLKDFFIDTANTIYEFNKHSAALYPDVFKPYNYGEPYNSEYAQYHPSYQLNNILSNIAFDSGLTIENIGNEYRLLASKKYVCPQNTMQVAEMKVFGDKLENNLFTIFGGQHVTNDMSIAGNQQITFNRNVQSSMRIFYCFGVSNTATRNQTLYIKVNDITRLAIPINCYNTNYGQGIVDFAFSFKADDKLTVYMENTNKFSSVSLVIRFQHRAYNITEDDYGTELEYVARRPQLVTKSATQAPYIFMDGRIQNNMQTEKLSFAYFGYYCNVPDVTIGDILFSLQWLYGGKVKQKEEHIYFEKNTSSTMELEAEMQNLVFSDTAVGQKNYVKFKDQEYPTPIATIDNAWLVEEKNLHVNCFKYIANNYVVKQYEKENYEEDDEVKTRYNFVDFDEPVLFRYINNNMVSPTLYQYNLTRINQSKSCDFITYNAAPNINDIDFVIVNGRQFFVISGEKNMKSNAVKLHCLLIYQ